ncbi:MAG: 4Fe-4S binding protein [Sedimentisphaerales bacterium]|nr:4Fe-4S binding protein [Sedimentisphaerales bacterium]
MEQNTEQTQGKKASPQKVAPGVPWLRSVVQIGFVLFFILLGIQFAIFLRSLATPLDVPTATRPPAVEAFLPISSLMSLVYLIKTGIANTVRPAGLVIFSLTIVLSLALRRGFCSWVCPIGTISEWAHKAGKKLFGRNLLMPLWLDISLRAVKYLLLAFFVYYIVRMSGAMLGQFIHGDYNRIADAKMYVFFSNISLVTAVVIIGLLVLSIVFKNFACRYLCPYGALLAVFSGFSATAVRRDVQKCINCGACARACPNRIEVDKKIFVGSADCTACYNCIHACKKPEALRMGVPGGRRISFAAYGIIVIVSFILASQIARACHYWQSDTTTAHYKQLYQNMEQIGHP